jgi:hypothetical protein
MFNASAGQIVVTVDDRHRGEIDSVAGALRTAGMQITSIMPTVGIIAGHAFQAQLQALSSVPGVVAVEPDEEMQTMA